MRTGPHRAEEAYAVLLRLYPVSERRRFGTEMTQLFRQSWHEARGVGTRRAVFRFWARTLRDVLLNASLARLQAMRRRGSARRPAHHRPRNRTTETMHNFYQDIRYAVQWYIRRPGFSLIAGLTIALGIGASTTIFSVVDAVMLRPLPYEEASRLVVLGTTYLQQTESAAELPVQSGLTSTSAPNFLEWRERSTSFEGMAAVMGWMTATLVGDGEPQRVGIAGVSTGFLTMLGMQPSLGRAFAPEEYAVGAAPVAILSHGLWQRRWGGDEAIIGKTIQAANQTITVVGVMPRDLHAPEGLWVSNPGMWMPVAFADPQYADRGRRIMRVVARLKAGVSVETARQEMTALGRAMVAEYPELSWRGNESHIGLNPLLAETVRDVKTPLLMLLGAVGLLLLIACANVANLFLARGTGRARELALRRALGAGRLRLIRQLLTESVVLGVAGGAGGIFLAFVGVGLFTTFTPGGVPRLGDVGVDLRIMVFAFALSVATGIVFGLVPAFQGTRDHAAHALKSSGVKATAGKNSSLLRNGLVVAETGLALVLLVGAGLLFNSFIRLHLVDPGFTPDNVYTMNVRLAEGYSVEERGAFFEAVIRQVEQAPGVESVGATMNIPIGDTNWRSGTRAEGARERADVEPANIHTTFPNYFATIGIRLVEGRDFTGNDRAGQPPVAIVNESLARYHWPGESALGKRMRIGYDGETEWLTVVGVVGDVKQRGLEIEQDLELFRPYLQGAESWMAAQYIVVRTDAPAATVAPLVRQAVWTLDPMIPLGGLASMTARISRSMTAPRFYTIMLGTFATVALVLAAAGVYGTMLYTVGERTREMGIRIALGAESNAVMGMIVRRGLSLAAAGVAVGLVGALLASRVLSSFLFGVAPTDAGTFAFVSLALLGVALVACYLPARRATRVDPMTALRTE